jgi:hypothetical protein
VSTPCIPWQSWAPPLDPPTAGGLPVDQAQCIADALWEDDPHLCAALMWEAYAAMLPPAVPVASVSTGVQNVSYSPAASPGKLGEALSRAAWHRSFVSGALISVPLEVAMPRRRWPRPAWWIVDDDEALP